MIATTEHARTWLFTPGSSPQRFGGATRSGADEVVLDLEDGVDPSEREEARRHVAGWLEEGGTAVVRVNASEADLRADVAALMGRPGLRGVMLSKAESPAGAAALSRSLHVGVVALVESARGLICARELASTPGVVRLALGSIDLSLDLGADDSWDALLLARCELVLASRSAGLAGPVDGVTTVVQDAQAVTAAARRARSLGFEGKLCIHPAQVPAARAGLAPAQAQVAWAERVMATHTGSLSARVVDGEMVDLPVLSRARRLLSEHRAVDGG